MFSRLRRFRFLSLGEPLSGHWAAQPLLLPMKGRDPVFGPNPFQCLCYFPFAGERYVAAFAVFGATAAAWDAVKRARHNRSARGAVPFEYICGAKAKTFEIEEAILAFDDGKPGKAPSLPARHRFLNLS